MAKAKAVQTKKDVVVGKIGGTKISTGKPPGSVKNTTKGPGTKKAPKV
jgi:hypothetical protein